MFLKSLLIFVIVFFSACNVESGKSTSTSSTATTTTQVSNGTTPSTNTQTNGVQTGGNTVSTGGTSTTTGVSTGSNVTNDQAQGSSVPAAPNFGFGF